MKEFIRKNILLVILISVFVVLLLAILIRNYLASKSIYKDSTLNEKIYDMVPKTYEVNEYSNMLISDDDMARIYLNDYLKNVNKDMRASYYLLDEEYRNERFNGVNDYVNYINNLRIYNLVEKYYKKETKDYIIYGVYDANGNFYAFKTNGVMQYKVYLDDQTVEIW